MSKCKLRISQIVMVVCIIPLFMGVIFSPAKATSISGNIEVLNLDEIVVEELCSAAGGICHIDIRHVVDGISISKDN